MNNNHIKIYTPYAISKIIENLIVRPILSKNSNEGFYIKGILGELKQNDYPYFYNIPLRDDMGIIYLDIPKKIGEQFIGYQNKEVCVFGHLKAKTWQGGVQFTLDVSNISPVQEISPELQRQEKTLIQILRSTPKITRTFPDLERYKIDIICGVSSQVRLDFERQVTGLNNIELNFIPVNILSTSEIISAINASKGDILILLRGGGSPSEFEVFNDLELLSAWVNKSTYKISALGHTEHKTYIDILSDLSADTPTMAGSFIKNTILSIQKAKEHEKEILTIQNRLIEEWSKKLKEREDILMKDIVSLKQYKAISMVIIAGLILLLIISYI